MVTSHSGNTLPTAPETPITVIPTEMDVLFISIAREVVHKWTCPISKLRASVVSWSCVGIVKKYFWQTCMCALCLLLVIDCVVGMRLVIIMRWLFLCVRGLFLFVHSVPFMIVHIKGTFSFTLSNTDKPVSLCSIFMIESMHAYKVTYINSKIQLLINTHDLINQYICTPHICMLLYYVLLLYSLYDSGSATLSAMAIFGTDGFQTTKLRLLWSL